MALQKLLKNRPLMKRLKGQAKKKKVTRVVCEEGKCYLTLEDGSKYECVQVVLQDFGELSESRIDSGMAQFLTPVKADLDPHTTFLFGEIS